MKAESINTNAIGATVLCYLPGRIHITHRKFWVGCSFSISNCNIRSWGRYRRNGSNLMRLTPNSTISVVAKKTDQALEERQCAREHRMQKL